MQRKLMFLEKSCKFRTMKNITIYKILLITIYFTFISASVIWAEDGSRVKDFYSPFFIAGSSSVTNLLSPNSEAINPASGALTQRVTLDLSYLGLMGDDGVISGYKGHGLNIGNTIPTKAGVFSWSGHYFYSPFISLMADPTFSINSSFSKALYPDFLVGAGLKIAGSLEPGMAAFADIGVISLMGKLGPFNDFKWGFVLQDLGYSEITNGYPEPFSVTGGVSANLLDSELFKINGYTDLGLIGLTDFKSVLLTFGTDITFKDIFTFNIGTRIDSYDLLDKNSYSLIPSFGFHYSFKTDIKEDSSFLGMSDRGWNQSEVNIQTGVAPISDNVWAAGIGVNIPLGLIDKSPPVIKLDISGFETDDNPDDSTNIEESEPVSMIPNKAFSNKTNSVKTKFYISTYLTKSSGKSTPVIKNIDTGSSKYKGRYDKRYLESGISFYISPNNDGIKDDLTFPINISDSRYLKGYAFLIKDSNGNIVREIRNKEKRIENQGFSGFFDRLFSVESGIEIPEEFRWDGLNNDGSVVSDGLYYFSVEAWDDNGNSGSSDSYAIVVDSIPPQLTLTEPDDDQKIFSPNEDGNKDNIRIIQNGSDENLWEGEILNSLNEIVKTIKFIDTEPLDIVWNGTDDNGIMTIDGVYSYKIKSLDRAGNLFTAEVNNIIKNTEETPITLNIDKSYFSPNNDMILDSLIFSTDIPVKDGIISWNLNILDSDNKIRRSISGEEIFPEKIVFDGRDSNGIRLEEGIYSCFVYVLYQNGNNPDSKSPVFTIDVSPPFATVKSGSPIFSPNGDGKKDDITFYQESSTEINWTGLIKSEDGKIINEYQWLSAADSTVSWNGTLSDGKLAPDGNYTYQLISIDRAGNAGQSQVVSFILNTEETPVILTTDMQYFSPNGDSLQDNVSIIPELKVKEGIASYSLDILDEDSNVVRNFSGGSNIPVKFVWNGIQSDGRSASDGIYKSNLTITYKKGDTPTSTSPEFIIDTIFPVVSISTDYVLFSPDSDGNKDYINIAQTTSSEELWQAEVLSEEGLIVNSFFWKGSAKSLNWNGQDDKGNILPDGKYIYNIFSSDKAGNRSSEQIRDIELDTKPTTIFLTVNDKYLSPTGNGLFEDLVFSTIVNNKNRLNSWSLKMIHENGNVEKEFKGNSGIPKNITWNGVNDSGKIIEGNYFSIFSVVYDKGNAPEVRSSLFSIDISPPIGTIKLSPVPFSPDNDGVEDEILIKLNVSDASGIKNWTLEIDDPERRSFKIFSGEGSPAQEIIWDGKSSNGELVYAAMDYPVKLILEDNIGNISVFKDKIPVDVLVVREGDVLKIKIANILFKVNSPELLADSPKVIEQNKFILNRVSELLKKYNSYRITIEGHAVLTRWNNAAAAKKEETEELGPLSEQRAVTVLKYLTQLGVPQSRMDSKGMGGTQPLVPHSDLENRWKNRRVEFILWKE
ncbi:MAG: OmpA family protein [Spirochaetales bacterium]|nr:OmpA family protein [Spirochaetales bacterium]